MVENEVMTTELLHALWPTGEGLLVWVERVDGHVVLKDIERARDSLPDEIVDLLAPRRFGKQHETVLQTPSGKRKRLTLPTIQLAPGGAAALLQLVSRYESHPGISAEVKFLARVVAGIRAYVKAGRVLLVTSMRGDQQRFLEWRLSDTVDVAAWRVEVARSIPPVLAANGPKGFLDEFISDMTEAVVSQELDEHFHFNPPTHRVMINLVDHTALPASSSRLGAALTKWRQSMPGRELELVLKLDEPQFDDADPADLWELLSDGEGEVPENVTKVDAVEKSLDSDLPVWPLTAMVRVGTKPPLRITSRALTPGVEAQLKQVLAAGVKAFPQLAEAQSGPEGGLDLMLSGHQVVRLLTTGVRDLGKVGVTVLLPRAWTTVPPTVRVHIQDLEPTGNVTGATPGRVGLDQLVKYKWEISIGDRKLTSFEMEQLAESDTGLIAMRDQFVRADTTAMAKIMRFLRAHSSTASALGEGETTLAELNGIDDEVSEKLDGVDVKVEAKGDLGTVFRGVVTPKPEPIAEIENLHAELRRYQREGVEWLNWMSERGFGAVLADDMGLGKTVQVLALLQHERNVGKRRPSLIVAPTSVAQNWVIEAAKFTPGLTVLMHHGAKRLKGDEFAAAAKNADVMVTTYPMLDRDLADLSGADWDHLILDEAQAIKNPNTKVTKAALALPARHRIALTGTPVENNLGELRTIMDFCNRGMLGSAREFRNRWAGPIEKEENGVFAARLQRLIAPFIMRRVKTDRDIIADLPEKQENIEAVPMTVEQASLYRTYVKQMMEMLNQAKGMSRKALVLMSLTRLKQICNHPAHYLGDGSAVLDGAKHRSGKVERMVELLDDADAKGEKTLIFTQYREFGSILEPYLAERYGRQVPFLHGGVPRAKRQTMVEDFNGSDRSSIMILSLKAGGTGLNLTSANHVIHVDRWWNPAVENQATDRAYRIGQEKDVSVHKLVSRGTLEERIDELIDGKVQLAGAVLGKTNVTELDDDTLRHLLTLRVEPRNDITEGASDD